MQLSSVYVCVEEMERAREFYGEVFERAPTQAEERFSTFSFDGVDFGLYDPGYDGFETDYGDNCIPNFEVEDAEAAYRRIERIAPEMVNDEVLKFGDYHTFHFVDTEGNEIEVFSIDSS